MSALCTGVQTLALQAGGNASVRPPQDRQRSVCAKRNTSGKTSPYRRFVNWNRIHGLRKLNHFVPEMRALRTIEAFHAFPRLRDLAFRVRTSDIFVAHGVVRQSMRSGSGGARDKSASPNRVYSMPNPPQFR